MPRDYSAVRVGVLVVGALLVLAAMVLMVGDQNFLFTPTQKYSVRFFTVGGLATDSPVQLNGVNVGKVDSIVLSEDTTEEKLRVWIKVERRYAPRIRSDSVARIKTLGLLGDKYVDVSVGSPGATEIKAGEEIQAAQPTDVGALIESGEDVADSLVTTARSLSVILSRMERGEGLLGELVAEREGGRVTDTLTRTLESFERLANQVESGRGTVGRLLTDHQLADQLVSTIGRIDSVLASVQTGDGLLPALLHDGAMKERFSGVLTDFETTLDELGMVVADLRSAEGLLPRLINDEEFSRKITGDLEELLDRLNGLVEKIGEGEGTAARLLNDPAIYDALNDVVVGVNESKLLSWLIRNRQKAGIKKRYRDAQDTAQDTAEAAPPP